MPFTVFQDKTSKRWKVKNKDGKVINKEFLSKDKAISTSKNWLRYRHETAIVVKGSKIYGKKPKKSP